jgi:glycosyltransferase involved in cell wall biosynthesis
MNFDLIANDELACPELLEKREVNFFNLRGDQRPDASLMRKAIRISAYYAKLIRYAASARPTIFHILWNNRFEFFDRTLLMLYYRALGKKIVLTLHNVNAGTRDANDSALNRLTLRIQYQLTDHMFVHTKKMKQELIDEYGIPERRISIIPFGINNSVPDTALTSDQAKQRLGISQGEKTILFYGNIAPYKGLEYLVRAFSSICRQHDDYRLIIAGRPKDNQAYWTAIEAMIREDIASRRILLRAEFIPDEDTELYFKAADVMVLPYTHIYQSGVLFLGYSFGLPVLASDVGSLSEEVVEDKTGFIFPPKDVDELARQIERYFASDLYGNLSARREGIVSFAAQRNSWDRVAESTLRVYSGLSQGTHGRFKGHTEPSSMSLDSRVEQ